MATLASIAANNTLEGAGKVPYHLVASFKLFTLEGGSAESGTVEEWWSEAGGTHVEVRSPSLGILHSTETENGTAAKRRELYLIAQALGEFSQAGSDLTHLGEEAVANELSAGKTDLRCYQASLAGEFTYSPATQVCLDPQLGVIRVIRAAKAAVLRNRIATFGKVYVALDQRIFWNGLPAIDFHVDSLKSFRPEEVGGVPGPASDAPEAAGNAAGSTKLRGGITAGHKISGPQPEYPDMARSQRISGSVVLGASISSTGKVENLFPIACSSELLIDAALRAVEQWRYTPFLLNGKPTTVMTTLTINFNLNPR